MDFFSTIYAGYTKEDLMALADAVENEAIARDEEAGYEAGTGPLAELVFLDYASRAKPEKTSAKIERPWREAIRAKANEMLDSWLEQGAENKADFINQLRDPGNNGNPDLDFFTEKYPGYTGDDLIDLANAIEEAALVRDDQNQHERGTGPLTQIVYSDPVRDTNKRRMRDMAILAQINIESILRGSKEDKARLQQLKRYQELAPAQQEELREDFRRVDPHRFPLLVNIIERATRPIE